MRRVYVDPLDWSTVRTPRSRTLDGSSRSQPERTCVGCRARVARTDLVRVVAITEGTSTVLVPDLNGSAAGRGAHLHPTIECFELAVRRKAFVRALRLAGPSDATAVRDYLATHAARKP